MRLHDGIYVYDPDFVSLCRRRERAIRRDAKKLSLTAQKARSNGRWYFADANNTLVSDHDGLDTDGASEFLSQLEQEQSLIAE